MLRSDIVATSAVLLFATKLIKMRGSFLRSLNMSAQFVEQPGVVTTHSITEMACLLEGIPGFFPLFGATESSHIVKPQRAASYGVFALAGEVVELARFFEIFGFAPTLRVHQGKACAGGSMLVLTTALK